MPIYVKNGYKVLFVHIPKTGGTSIDDSFAPLWSIRKNKKPGWQYRHATYHTYEKWEMYNSVNYKFTIVRDPVERLASDIAFYDEIKKMYWKGDRWDLNLEELFSTFKSPQEYETKKWSNHIRPQSDFVREGSGNKIFYFDKLSEAHKELSYMFETEPLKHLKRHTKKSKPKPKFNEEQIKLIKEFYKEDYERFFNKRLTHA